MLWEFGVLTFDDFGMQVSHVLRQEGWLQSCQLVNDATEGPNVALFRVWLIQPDFWRTVKRGSCLSLHYPTPCDSADVKIA